MQTYLMGAFSQASLPDKTSAKSFAESLLEDKHPHPKNGAFACGTPAGKKRRARGGATDRGRRQLRSLVRRSTQSLFHTRHLGVAQTTPPEPRQTGQPIPGVRPWSKGVAVDFALGSCVCFSCAVRSPWGHPESPRQTLPSWYFRYGRRWYSRCPAGG